MGLAELPAEIDDASVAQMREVDEPQADVLHDAAHGADLVEDRLGLLGRGLEALAIGTPPRPIEHAAAGERETLPLPLEPLAHGLNLGMGGAQPLDQLGELRNERLHVVRGEIAVSHGRVARRRSRALPSDHARRV